MSESLVELLATDAELDLLANRRVDGGRDLVLAELALLAAAVDEAPLPPVVRGCASPAMSSARKGGWALSVTVALMITSSGVAAAVSENPLAPLHYVTNQVWELGPHNGGKLPGWEINGSMPVSTVPRADMPGVSVASSGSGSLSASPDSRAQGTGAGDGGSSGGHSGTGPGGAGVGSGGGVTGHPPTSRPGSGTGTGSGPGHQGNSKPRVPRGGRGPTNVGNGGPGVGNARGPSSPTRPGEPLAHQNEQSSGQYHPGAGQAPGTSHCRIDHPSIPVDSTWGEASGLHPCQGHPSLPHPPVTPPRLASPVQPKLAPASPASSDALPTTPGSVAASKPESSQVVGSLR